MRKYQVQRAFEVFCGDCIIPTKETAYGGLKNPHVRFWAYGICLHFDARVNKVFKAQARDTLVFESGKELLTYVKQMEAMKMQDPNYQGINDE